jgi:hypothetical protein
MIFSFKIWRVHLNTNKIEIKTLEVVLNLNLTHTAPLLICELFKNLFKIFVGLSIDVLLFFPAFLLVFLFRNTISRKSKSLRLKKTINTLLYADQITAKSNMEANENFTLPFWFKYLLYGLSFLLMTISIFFTLLKGKQRFKIEVRKL